MAFPVRKRRQIGQLAFLLIGFEPEPSGVRVSPGAPSPRTEKSKKNHSSPESRLGAPVVCPDRRIFQTPFFF